MSKNTMLLFALIALLIGASGAGVWMLVQPRSAPAPSRSTAEQTKTFTMDEVSRHNTRRDCWTVISGDVYDLTDYVNGHPGGTEILRACGIDATSLFNERQTAGGQPVGSGTPHSQRARDQLTQLKIGTLSD